jgi:hypothetical protein
MNRIIDWIFDTIPGRIVGLCFLPAALILWFLSTLIVGEEFFSWLEGYQLRKAAGR